MIKVLIDRRYDVAIICVRFGGKYNGVFPSVNVGKESFPGNKLTFEINLGNRISFVRILTCLMGGGSPSRQPPGFRFLFVFFGFGWVIIGVISVDISGVISVVSTGLGLSVCGRVRHRLTPYVSPRTCLGLDGNEGPSEAEWRRLASPGGIRAP